MQYNVAICNMLFTHKTNLSCYNIHIITIIAAITYQKNKSHSADISLGCVKHTGQHQFPHPVRIDGRWMHVHDCDTRGRSLPTL